MRLCRFCLDELVLTGFYFDDHVIPIDQASDGTGTPNDPDRFVADLATALNAVLADPARTAEMGTAGRRRAVEDFSWDAVAEQTTEIYRSVLR